MRRLRRHIMVMRLMPTLGLAGVAGLLSSCAEMHRGFERVGSMAGSPVAETEDHLARPAKVAVKTVRPRAERDAPVVVADAIPSPREIFEFHSAGADPESWRKPFIIADDDGPLTPLVRKTAADLREYKAGIKARDVADAKAPACGGLDPEADGSGCIPPARRAITVGARNPLALR